MKELGIETNDVSSEKLWMTLDVGARLSITSLEFWGELNLDLSWMAIDETLSFRFEDKLLETYQDCSKRITGLKCWF